MIVFLVFVGLALVVAVVRRRAGARKSTLAGLDSARPQFVVEPPLRRLGSIKQERLR